MSTLKKSLSLVLAVLMLISVFTVAPLTAGAAETHKRHTKANTEKKPSGEYITSGDYSYYLNSDGEAEIDFYNGNDEDLVIPDSIDGHKVTIINPEVFYDKDFIKTVKIPDSVKSIGSDAFYCTGFYNNESNWEDGVLYCGKFLIKADNMTGTYTVKPGTTVIADGAFYEYHYNEETDEETYSSNLQGVVIPSSVTHIGESAFEYCDNLASVTLSNGLKYIGSYAFNSCNSLKSITIPDSVTEINESAFSRCYSLENVTLPSGISTISYGLFRSCDNLNSINIPSSVTSIGSDAFYDTGIYNNDANWENNVLYIGKYLIKADNMTGTYTIKPGTTVIADDAFHEYYYNEETDEETYSNLQGIVIPGSVTYIGDDAFYRCDKLTSVTLSNGIKYIGEYAFDSCKSLKSITIPDSVIKLGQCSFFRCDNLSDVKIGNGVKEIGAWAFENTALQSATIPANVTSIGRYAFGYNEIQVEEYDYIDTKIDNFTINGYEKTAAETYANENGFTFNKLTPPASKGNAVTKKANTLKAKAVNKTIKAKKLKKKAVTFKAVKVSGAKGKVTYKVTKKNKKLKFKNGKITVKKKTKKGTYKIKVKVTAAGTSAYKKGEKTVTIKVKVK